MDNIKKANNNYTPSKQATFKLYSNPNCPYCLKLKMILAEKEAYVEIVNIDLDNKPMELFELNPYGQVPTIMSKDMILYDSDLIFEYLEDRFPHPQLMPTFPIERAQIRMLCKRFSQEIMPLVATSIFSKDSNKAHSAKVELVKTILLLIPIFKKHLYFMSEKYTVLDCTFAAILYSLPKIGITLPPSAKPIIEYKERIFERKGFKHFLEMQANEDKSINVSVQSVKK